MVNDTDPENTPPRERSGYPTSIQPFPKDVDDWTGEDIKPSINNIYAATVSATQSRIDWYDKKAAGYAVISQRLRIYSIYLIGIGALAPLVSEPLSGFLTFFQEQGNNDTPTPDPFDIDGAKIGYIVFAIAGTLVAIDNFFGYSDSWMRFRLTQADLVRRLVRFRYDWAEMLSALDQNPTAEQAGPLIRLHRNFVDSFEEVVQAETQTWASRLQNKLLSFDRQHKFDSHDELPGQIDVRVDGWEKLDAATRKLLIDDSPVEPGTSGRKLSDPLPPRSYTIKVVGQLDKEGNRPVELVESVQVVAGTTIAKTIKVTD